MVDIERLHYILLKNFPLTEDRPKHASFLMKAGKILSVGFNQRTKTHPWALKYGHKFCRVHSELDSFLNFPLPMSELNRFTLVNLRILKSGKLSIAKPCIACQHMLMVLRPKRVLFSNNDGLLEEF